MVPPVSSAANKADTRIHMQRCATADGVGSDHDQRLKDTDAFIAGMGGVHVGINRSIGGFDNHEKRRELKEEWKRTRRRRRDRGLQIIFKKNRKIKWEKDELRKKERIRYDDDLLD